MTAKSKTLKTKEVGHFTLFLTVGTIGTVLDFGLLSLLKAFGLPILAAKTLSFSAGVANNFTFNRLWTFADTKQTGLQKQLSQFLLISLVGLSLNNAIVLWLEAPLGQLLG